MWYKAFALGLASICMNVLLIGLEEKEKLCENRLLKVSLTRRLISNTRESQKKLTTIHVTDDNSKSWKRSQIVDENHTRFTVSAFFNPLIPQDTQASNQHKIPANALSID